MGRLKKAGAGRSGLLRTVQRLWTFPAGVEGPDISSFAAENFLPARGRTGREAFARVKRGDRPCAFEKFTKEKEKGQRIRMAASGR
ncbi:MAG: hypothetical protein BAA03_07230 [Caldibacillus debilis]|nr:MAG: hypothetical protein BAA03_07230 [Caldibacillus debilis]